MPVRGSRLRGGDHRKDGSDPDPARDEQVAGRVGQPDIVPRAADPDDLAGPQPVVDKAGAAAVRVTQDARPPHMVIRQLAAQRVLPGRQPVQDQVDVRARRPPGQRAPADLPQGQGHHPVRDLGLALHPDVGLELAGDAGATMPHDFRLRAVLMPGRGNRKRQVQVLPDVHVRRGPVALRRPGDRVVAEDCKRLLQGDRRQDDASAIERSPWTLSRSRRPAAASSLSAPAPPAASSAHCSPSAGGMSRSWSGRRGPPRCASTVCG